MTEFAGGLDKLAGLLHDLGYRAQIKIDGGHVLTQSNGVYVAIYFYTSGEIQLNTKFRDADNISLETMNLLNSSYRFIKAYKADAGILTVTADRDFDIEAESAGITLERYIRVYDTLLAEFRDVISKASKMTTDK